MINLQGKTKARRGVIECYWFENESIGLKNTLFHRISIPLEPFDSGFEYVEQPEETSLVIDWMDLSLQDPSNLEGIEAENQKDIEASVYVGSAHNWVEIEFLRLKATGPKEYEIHGKVTVEFGNELEAKNEEFQFTTTALFEFKA